ncbi:hypothetical protein [Halobacterium sp. CBA1126]|nr:hypothetical protein [Halobacterium sp. CBA1126]
MLTWHVKRTTLRTPMRAAGRETGERDGEHDHPVLAAAVQR